MKRISRSFIALFLVCSFASLSLSKGAYETAIAPSCPLCSCSANHCDAGVPKHLSCNNQTIAEKQRIDRRKFTFEQARGNALGQFTALCNEVVGNIAASLGFSGFKTGINPYLSTYMSANQLHDYLASGGGSRAGWAEVSGEAITQHADIGQLVVGVIHSSDMGRAHGHTFVVLPGGKQTDTGRELKILHASYEAKLPTEESLSRAIKREFLGKVKYYAYKVDATR